MPGVHKVGTISFRPDTSFEKELIEKRADLSGMSRKDFYVKSILYSNVCVVGKRENIEIIVNALRECQDTVNDIASQLKAGNFSLSKEAGREFCEDFLTTIMTVTEILDGAAYLFDQQNPDSRGQWKLADRLEQLRNIANCD